MSRPLFTVVTPALNCGPYLKRNLASIRSQGLPEGQLEHWIIDGGSTDETLAILRAEPGIHFISEKDACLSDAVNKGLRRAQGEWILWVNADDELAPGALKAFLEVAAQSPEVALFCGDQRIFNYEGGDRAYSKGWKYTFEALIGPRPGILQASTFVRRRVYEEVGLLDLSFRYAMDYEWTVRAVSRFPCVYVPILLSHYHCRRGSIMDANRPGFYADFLRVRRRYGISIWNWEELRMRAVIWRAPFRRIRFLYRAYLWTKKYIFRIDEKW